MPTLSPEAIGHPHIKIGKLNMLSDAERQQLLVTWNDTAQDYPIDSRVEELFVAQAKQHPGRVAIEFEGRRLTYSQLDQQSSAVAGKLQHKGIEPGAIVGLCMGRSMEMVVGMLAILKVGGSYLPLDPKFPEDRLRFMIEDSGTGLILTHSKLRSKLEADRVSTIFIDEFDLGASDVAFVRDGLCSDSIAYLIYTSGSTGTPKGVEVYHRAVVNFLVSMRDRPGMSGQDVLLAVTSISFDIHVLEFFLPLACGARVILADEETRVSGIKLAALIRDKNVTVMQATPATWRLLLNSGWEGSSNFKALCGGEAMPQDFAKTLRSRVGSLWNMFGPTETTVWSTVHEVLESDYGRIPIGKPINNTEIYILDDFLQPAPLGVSGDLYIGGHGLAKGYLKRPELTAERFIMHPFSSNPDDRIYKTGDLARYLPNGNIEFLGRSDNQVKIRGHRIEPGEIEVALMMQPEVQECAVVAKEFSPGDLRLVAYVAYQLGEDANTLRLQAALHDKLPDYMVPSYIFALNELPRTPNGKLDRPSLASRDIDVTRSKTSCETPNDQIELNLIRLWEHLLDVKPVGLHDDFFDLGGHSLLGVELTVEIEKIYGKRLPLATLLQTRTVAELADLIRSENWKPSWDCLVPLRASGAKPPLFLVHAAGGNVLIYEELAKNLEDKQPVYGVQAMGLDDEQSLPSSVEEMARAYRLEIQKMQPIGPYLLGGYCLGGTIALEIAAQLFQRGEQVAFLGMLDAHNWANMKEPSVFEWGLFYWQKFNFHLRNLWRLRPEERSLFLKGKMSELLRRRTVWADSIRPRAGRARQVNGQSLSALWANNDRIAEEYRPRSYPGRITHICPMGNYSKFGESDGGWERIALGGVDVFTLSVYPAGMLMEPYVRQLAEAITKAIDRGLLYANVSTSMDERALGPAPGLLPVSKTMPDTANDINPSPYGKRFGYLRREG